MVAATAGVDARSHDVEEIRESLANPRSGVILIRDRVDAKFCDEPSELFRRASRAEHPGDRARLRFHLHQSLQCCLRDGMWLLATRVSSRAQAQRVRKSRRCFTMKTLRLLAMSCLGSALFVMHMPVEAAEPIVWKFEQVSRIGQHETTLLGAPHVARSTPALLCASTGSPTA